MSIRTRTRVHKRTRLVGGKRAGIYLNWRKLGPHGWQQLVPVPGSLSVHALGETWNPQRRTISSNLPGPVDTVTTYGGPRSRGVRVAEPELDAWAVANIECPRPTCRSQPGQGCVTPSGRPARMHMQRRELARTQRHYGPDVTPGGRSTRPGPLSPLGQLVARVLGWLAVLAVAWAWVVVLGAASALDVLTREVGQ